MSAVSYAAAPLSVTAQRLLRAYAEDDLGLFASILLAPEDERREWKRAERELEAHRLLIAHALTSRLPWRSLSDLGKALVAKGGLP